MSVTKREQLKARRLQKTEEYLNKIGVMIPIIKEAKMVKTTDIIKNEDFIKKIDVFVLENIEKNTESKELKSKLKGKGSRKSLLNKFIKERLEPTIVNLPEIVWGELLTTIMVDNLEGDESEWIDFEFPLFQACSQIYDSEIEWLKEDITNIGIADVKDEIADFVDYVCMMVSINLFQFARKLDEQSRYQIMGNIGSLDDIRSAVELTFIGEIFSYNKNMEWFNNIA